MCLHLGTSSTCLPTEAKQRRRETFAYLSDEDDAAVRQDLDVGLLHPTAGHIIVGLHGLVRFKFLTGHEAYSTNKVVLDVGEVDARQEVDVVYRFIVVVVERVNTITKSHLIRIAKLLGLFQLACV